MTECLTRCFLGVAALTLIVSAALLANNPIAVNSGGNATKWGAFPITYTRDGGQLGALSNAQANTLTSDAFGAWAAVATASVAAVAGGGSLSADGDVDTIGEFNEMGCVGMNPMVYDHDGSLTDTLLGAGAKNNVLGFAGPCAIQPHPNGFLPGNSDTILGGRATMNGFLITGAAGLAYSRSKGVFIHELGHFLGIGHSQVNLNCLTNLASCPDASADLNGVPTMFPILLNQTSDVAHTISYSETLTADDQSAISTLYPNPNNSFSNNFGTITGNVRLNDGVNEAQGINVIARLVTDPRATAISNTSGMFANASSSSSAGNSDSSVRGDFTIPGLSPGTYTLEIESINPSFIGGSRVGALSGSTGRGENIPIPSPATAECFGGPESNTDNPATCQNIPVGAGGLSNNDFVLNATFTTLDAFDAVARNENIGAATPIDAGTYTGLSMSGPTGRDDQDFYALNVTQDQPISVEIKSRRLSPQRYLSSTIKIYLPGMGGVPLQTCRIGDSAGPYDQFCENAGYTPTGGSFTRDAKLQFLPGFTGVVYLSLNDLYGDARPDFIYDMTIAGVAPPESVQFIPATLDMGTQFVGIAGFPREVQVKNTNAGNVTLTSLATTGGNSGDFVLGAPLFSMPACALGGGTVLAANGSCYFSVTFTPGAAGNRSTTVRLVHTGADTPSDLAVAGVGSSGPPNDLRANATTTDPSPFSDFQDTTLATQSVDDITLGGGLPAFSCNVAVPPANNKSIWYKFTTPAAGNGSITATPVGGYDVAVAIATFSGGVFTPQACANSNPSGIPETIGLNVSAGMELFFMVAAVTGDGGPTLINFTFTPDGVNADLSISKTDNNLVFTESFTGSYTITVTNSGTTATSSAMPVTVVDLLPPGFSYSSVSSPGSVWNCTPGPGIATCSLGGNTIAGSGGSSAFTLTLAVAAPAAVNSPVTNNAQVFGGGDITSGNNFAMDTTTVNPAPAPVVDIAPPSKDFGSVASGAISANQSFTLLNSGNGTLNVSSITKTGTDAAQFNLLLAPAGGFTCGAGAFNLTAGASCTFGANFAPTGLAGARSANISVASNASTSPNLVALSGTNVPLGTLTGSPTPFNFGNQQVGTSSGAQTFVLSNTGPGDLMVTGLDVVGNAGNTDDYTLDGMNTTCPVDTEPFVPFPLTSMSSCNIVLSFTPVTLGLRQLTATFTATNSTVPSVAVAISGTGVAGPPANIFSPNTVTTFQTTAINTAFPNPLQVRVTDANGFPVAGTLVTFTVNPSVPGAGGTFAGGVNTATTDAGGMATAATLTANAITGNFTVSASTGVLAPVIFAMANLANTPSIQTIAGGGSGAVPSVCAQSQIGGIFGGFYYFKSCNQVFKTPVGGGAWTPVAGTGAVGYSGDGGLAVNAVLGAGGGIFVDTAGNVFIADAFNNRIRRVDAATGIIQTVVGNGFGGVSTDPTGDGGLAVNARLLNPQGVYVDPQGNIFIADTGNHRVRVVNSQADANFNGVFVGSGEIGTIAGNGAPGFSGDNNPATGAQLNNPQGVHVDGAQSLFIADTANGRIRRVDAGGTITTFAGGGGGFADGVVPTATGIAGPQKVWVDGSANVYIADTGNNRIRKVSGGLINTIAGTSSLGYSGDGGAGTAARTFSPNSVFVDGTGNVIFSSFNGIRRIDGVTGSISTVVGNSAFGFGGDIGPATSAQIYNPNGVARDQFGNIYIADTGNYRIRKVNGLTGAMSTIAGTGVSGQAGDGAAATAAQVRPASGIAADRAGNVYFVDRDPSGGNTLCAIRKIDTGGNISKVVGDGTCTSSGDGAAANLAGLGNPQGLSVDALGNLYVTQITPARVRVVNTQAGQITVNNVNIAAGNIATVAGVSTNGSGGDGGQATAAQLNNPQATAVDGAGNLYIADLGNNKVRVVASSGVINTFAGTGAIGSAAFYNGDNIPATTANLASPAGVAVNSAGDVMISEMNSRRVRIVPNGTNQITTVALNGVLGFSGDGGPAVNAASNSPTSIAVDAAANLLISDRLNARIRYAGVANPAPTITQLVPDTRPGGVGFLLTVNGTNFVPNSFVSFNGTLKATTYVSNTQVTAQISAADVAGAGNVNVTVSSPIPGGGTSGDAAFNITGVVITFTNGGGDNQWTNDNNWDLIRTPIASDSVIIPTALNPILSIGAQTITSMDMQGTATLTISGGSLTFTSVSTATNLTINGGTLTANAALAISGALNLSAGGTLNGTGNVTLNSPLTWTGGTMGGTGTFTNNGTGGGAATISGGTLDGTTFINNGTVNFATAANFSTSNGAVINNQAGATINFVNGQAILNLSGAHAALNNAGTVNKTLGGGSNLVSVDFTNTSATSVTNITGGDFAIGGLYLQTAGVTTLNGGNLSVSDGATISGGVLKGINTVSGPPTLTTLTVSGTGRVQPGLSPGILSVSSTATTTYSQQASGTLDIEINGTTVGTQYDQLAVTGAASLNGTLNVTTSGFTPNVGDSFTIITSTGARTGTFSTTNLASLPVGRQWNVAYTTNSVVLSVQPTPGTITFTNGGGDGLWTNPANWDLGRIPVAGDTVVISGAFNVTLNGGAPHTIAVLNMTSTGTLTITGAGTQLTTTGASNATNVSVVSSGHLTTNAALTIGSVGTPGSLNVNNGGLVDGTGNITISQATTQFNLGGGAGGAGTIGGTGQVTNNGVFSANGGAISARTLSNNGSANVSNLTLSNAATVANLAGRTINAQAVPGGITQGAGAASTLNNQGNFVLNPGVAGNYDVTGIAFNNTGTTTITTGSLRILGTGVYTQTGAGAVTEFSQTNSGDMTVDNPLQLQGGTLRGRRTINGTVNNTGGTVGPGLSAGVFTFSGAYTQGANPASLNIEIGGLNPGNAAGNHDQLVVSGAPGTATLGGTLNVSLLSFTPALGNSFTIVTSTGALTGTFATVNTAGAVLPAGLFWRTTYNANSVVLDVVAANLALTPDPRAFGNQQVGVTSAAQSVTLSNTGGASATLAGVNAVALVGAHPGDFTIAAGTTCGNGLVLAAGGNCIINVTFMPTATGPRTATLSVASNALVNPTTSGLTGTGVVPLASIAPPSPFNFGNQPTGSTSAAQIFSVSNGGAAGSNLTVTNIVLGGANQAEFVFTNAGAGSCSPLPKVLPSGGLCTFTVAFAPTSVAVGKTATVTVTSNDNNVPDSTQVLTVNGNGVAATVNLSPNPLQFGNQRKGTSNTLSVTATNSGGAPATLNPANAVTITGAADFVVAAGTTCTDGLVLAAAPGPGNTCIINITFTPSATGPVAAQVNVATNVAGSPHTAVMNGTGIAPIANVAPDPFDFGTRINGTISAAQTFTVSNTGTDTLNITSIVPGGTHAAEFNFANAGAGSCAAAGGVVQAGGNCTFTVAFAPVTSGAKVATVTVTDDDNAIPGTTQVVDLSGTGQTPPTANFSTLNIPFGSQRVGASTAATTVTVTNSGEFPLEMVSLSLTGADSSQFVLTNSGAGSCSPLPKTVLGGGNCTFTVAFAPTLTGAKAAIAGVSHNGNATGTPGTVTDVTLSGTGIQANVTLAPPAAFGNQRVGTTSGVMAVTATNSGTDIATLSGPGNPVTLAGANAEDFAIAAGTTCLAGTVLQPAPGPGNTCVINLTFTPSATAARVATVNLADDAPGSPQTAALTGTGIAPLVSIAPASPFGFGNQLRGTTSAAQTFTVSNTGTDTLNIASIVLDGTDAAHFVFTNAGAGSCAVAGGVVAAGANCTFTAAFAPTSTSTKTATVTLTDDNNAVPNSTQVITLNGTGTAPLISISPTTSPFPFGNQNINSSTAAQTFTVSNTGTATLNIASILLSGADAAHYQFVNTGAGSCSPLPKAVAIGANCTFTVAFAPTTIGAKNAANVTLTDDDNNVAGSTQVITLNGTATQPGLDRSSSSVPDFGNVQVGTSKAATGAGIITLSNPGTGPLTITSITVGGANSSDFSRTTTCPLAPATLAAGGNCTITASMNPQTGSAGPRTTSISVVHNGVIGTGTPSPTAIALSGTAVDFQLTMTTAPPPVVAGSTATYALNFDMSGGSSLLETTFACSGLPALSTCVFTPPSIPAGSSDTTVTLAISTTSNTPQASSAGVAGPATPWGGNRNLPPSVWLLISMSVLALFGVAALKRQALQLSAARVCLLVLLLTAGGYAAGCAGGPDAPLGTPPGNYTVTVTATSGAVQRSTNVTLTVQ